VQELRVPVALTKGRQRPHSASAGYLMVPRTRTSLIHVLFICILFYLRKSAEVRKARTLFPLKRMTPLLPLLDCVHRRYERLDEGQPTATECIQDSGDVVGH